MLAIHDSDFCTALRARADKLTPDATRQWGTMTPAQMLRHVNASLSIGLGKLRAAHQKPPMPPALMLPMALYLPWPKGKVQALPETVASGTYDFETERRHFHSLVQEFSLRPLHFNWLEHPSMGRISGTSWNRLEAKHVDYHFRQFGV